MKTDLAAVDVAIVAVYILGTTFIGAWFTGRQKNLRTYFVSDRNVSWWLVLISIVATETSTVTFLSVPGLAYNPGDETNPGGNLTFLQLAFGYIIGRMLIAWFLLPQYLRGELFSAYQLLRERFNPAVQRAASGIFLLTRAIADGLRLYLASLLLQQFTGWDSRVSLLVIGIATMIYTYLGGIQAVIWTDLIQFTIYIVGATVAAACILRFLPGGVSDFLQSAKESQKLVVINPSASWHLPYTLWAGLIGGTFFTMASHGADQMMVQRYLSSRSLNQARAALILSGVVVMLQFLLFLLIGVGLFVMFDKRLLSIPRGTRNDEVFGLFIVERLPHGLVGLVIAAVLSASMATLSSSLNSSANAFVTDFYQPLRPGRQEGHYLLVSRVMTSVWGMIRIAVALGALYLNSARSVVDQVLAVAGFTTGMILGLFILGSWKRPVAAGSAFAGLVAGFLAVLSVWLPSILGRQGLAWPWYAPIGSIVTVATALAVDHLKANHGSSADRRSKPGLDKSG
jgi:SSS family transporter